MQHILNKIKELEEVVKTTSSSSQSYKIGIGISTYNRYDVFKHTLEQINKYSAGCKIVVVDDASNTPVPEATYRFTKNVGIAAAKNKCFELLDDCEHIFLFDDDAYPLCEGWYLPYIESKEPHLMYIFPDFSTSVKLNDTSLLYQNDEIKAYSHPRGVMCYFKRICLDKVGGMDAVFGKWGWEHPDLSNRIYNAGLTSYKYMDVVGSEKLIYSADEHQKVTSTVLGAERQAQINKNKSIYEGRKDSKQYIPYKTKEDVILTCYFNGVKDPQRNEHFKADSSVLQPLINSLKGQKLVILHDCLEDKDTDNVKFVKVSTNVNPYFQRWISYIEYLEANKRDIRRVFCVDGTDVLLLKNPFNQMEKGKIYTGDEVEVIGCEWLRNHHKHTELVKFFEEYKDYQVINAGLLGGDIEDILDYMKEIVKFYMDAKSDNFHNKVPDAGSTDMGVFNYVGYKLFDVIHGTLVNTRFKAHEVNNVSWFAHK